jgi:hypothetical protein
MLEKYEFIPPNFGSKTLKVLIYLPNEAPWRVRKVSNEPDEKIRLSKTDFGNFDLFFCLN